MPFEVVPLFYQYGQINGPSVEILGIHRARVPAKTDPFRRHPALIAEDQLEVLAAYHARLLGYGYSRNLPNGAPVALPERLAPLEKIDQFHRALAECERRVHLEPRLFGKRRCCLL